MTTETFFRECAMCGKNATLIRCWYQYDNGEQFQSLVCPNCADLHLSLTKAGK